MLAVQIPPRICGGVAGNVSVQKLIRMFGSSSGVVFELRLIISNQNGQMRGWSCVI